MMMMMMMMKWHLDEDDYDDGDGDIKLVLVDQDHFKNAPGELNHGVSRHQKYEIARATEKKSRGPQQNTWGCPTRAT